MAVMNNIRKTKLIVIDPQNDFCTVSGPGGEKGTLIVSGADNDMKRLGVFITENKSRIDEIICTMDCHPIDHIAHGGFWVNFIGEHPSPFTVITDNDVANGIWKAYNPDWQSRAEKYVTALKKNGRYALRIWPAHCLKNTWGYEVVPDVAAALTEFSSVKYINKGTNAFTEHYSAVQADVPDETDKSTWTNTFLIDTCRSADEILFAGEALSHCVASSIRDIVSYLGEDQIPKFTFLEDASSNVYGCETLGQNFVNEMVNKGMKIARTTNW